MKQFYLNLNRKGECVSARHYPLLGLAKAVTRFKQQGFSLLELVVVIALLSIVALASTTLILDNGDLKRQQETESRWNQIHDAIISQPNLYLNGSPYVRGYVADMGRLPVSILELIRQSEATITYDEDGDAGTPEITIDQPDWQPIDLGYTAEAGYEDEFWGGWRGPYLYTAGSRQFRDGWGREDPDVDQDAFNFGWVINTGGEEVTEVTDLTVQSYGSDQEIEGAGDFTEDFPVDALNPANPKPIVGENEWTLSDSPITFNINFSRPQVPLITSLELRIYRYIDDGNNVTDINDVYIKQADMTFDLASGASVASATITPDAAVPPFSGTPIGRFAALIWCTNGTPLDPSDDDVYDGDCDSTIKHSPVYFTLTNNTSQVTLTWDLP